ncbi:MAG: M61 family peptidase [Bacteroidetes bacterium]|nr:M61 family peptidase [Bacteroidota bacterium]
MNYTLSTLHQGSRFLSVLAEFSTHGRDEMEIQLSSWRPGRYEIGNFAKNIRKFEVYSQDGEVLGFHKINKDRWLIHCSGKDKIRISYEYFASTLDAGSTFCGKDLLYVNPVNCLVYDPDYEMQACEVLLKVPDNYQIASSMQVKGKRLFATDYHELADSPLIASPDLVHHLFEVEGYRFHVWLQGKNNLDITRFMVEAKAYTMEQLKVFGDMETEEYHYLFIFLPTRYHHGVEHHASTVIVMGPGEEFNQEARHHEFLAISSHELFHYWNVKRIRPADMFPYDYTKENYSRMGYVYEGITTYYGDYMLLRSGVLNFDDYTLQANADLQKHFDNEGRYHYSVAESSFDTWLDGYVPGVPGRKVSIYTEGMLAALMLDIEVRCATQNQSSLDTVMKRLYVDFYKEGLPYTEKQFKQLIEEVAGKSFDFFFHDFYWGKGNIEKALPKSLWSIGCEIKTEESSYLHEAKYGFKLSGGQKVIVTTILEDSPAEHAGLSLNDEVMLINNTPVGQGTDWNQLFNAGSTLLVWNSIEGSKTIDLVPNGGTSFKRYSIRKLDNATADQKAFFEAWSGQKW